jgi:integrase
MRRAKQASTIKFFTTDELKRLLSAIDTKRNKALFLVAYRHGLRASEVGLLRRSDLDLKSMRLTVHRLKGSIGGVHPVQADEAKAIKAYLRERDDELPTLFTSRRGDPISRRTLDWLIKEYGRAAKLPKEKLHFHTLKHSIATHLLDAGGDLRFVQDWLGHANIQNTVIYAALVSRSRDETARRVFMKMPQF